MRSEELRGGSCRKQVCCRQISFISVRDRPKARRLVSPRRFWLRAAYIKPTRKDSNEIALIMQGMEGWVRQENTKHFKDYGSQKFWQHQWEKIE